MPWAFVQYSWFGLAMIAGRYLICIDRTRLTIVPLLAGLVSSAVLMLQFTPRWGLPGAALAMAIANGVAFFALIKITSWCGMKWDSSTLLAIWLPASLCAGGWTALALLIVTVLTGWRGQWLISADEAEQIRGLIVSIAARFAPWIDHPGRRLERTTI